MVGWISHPGVPISSGSLISTPLFQPYASFVPYINAAIVLTLGYNTASAIGNIIYHSMREVADHSQASALRTISKIGGVAVLLSLLTSVFGINPSAALTLGSFSGLVIGFATQTVLTHAAAGIFLVISRPFKHGDLVTLSGQTGFVKEIRLMHTILRAEDGKKEILIPSGSIVGATIIKGLEVHGQEGDVNR
ncbi:mechanosensitive ion channel [Candidatus Bathyarchaeota archaeon]|nr:mechanosensitive ion channel [Candidatus Bathyarchaeota archaeon]